MGGGIAQEIAIEHPERVITLTLMSTSLLGDDLPPPADRISKMFSEPAPSPDWTDRAAVIQSFMDMERAFSGSIPVDEERTRAIAGRMFDRTRDVAASMTNHWILEGGDSEPIRPRLGQITAPALVIHGTEDPLFPLPHGEALAREIPGATLLPIEGMGHQMPPPQVWDEVVAAILPVRRPETKSDQRVVDMSSILRVASVPCRRDGFVFLSWCAAPARALWARPCSNG